MEGAYSESHGIDRDVASEELKSLLPPLQWGVDPGGQGTTFELWESQKLVLLEIFFIFAPHTEMPWWVPCRIWQRTGLLPSLSSQACREHGFQASVAIDTATGNWGAKSERHQMRSADCRQMGRRARLGKWTGIFWMDEQLKATEFMTTTFANQ